MSPIEKSSERARLSWGEVVLDIGPWYLERGWLHADLVAMMYVKLPNPKC
jgi:hypothetical protein